jgi:hypothetical protein
MGILTAIRGQRAVTVHMQMTTQPANYQIVNYNINPAPCIALDINIEGNLTVNASLIESTSQQAVSGGFQNGGKPYYLHFQTYYY